MSFRLIAYIFLLNLLLVMGYGCKDIESSVGEFQSPQLKFLFSTPKDVENILSMFKQSEKDSLFFYGEKLNDDTLLKDINDALRANEEYALTQKIKIPYQEFIWSITSKIDAKNHIKPGDFLGIIQGQIYPLEWESFPKNYKKIFKNKRMINMARFLKSAAQNQGFGTQACKAFVTHIFDHDLADIIMSQSEEENLPSRNSALACGFREVGTFRYKNNLRRLLVKER